MIVDSSAVVSIVLKEPGWEALVEKMLTGETKLIGAPTLVESGMVLTARIGAGARAKLDELCREFEIETVPFGKGHWPESLRAFHKFGKGRHAAALNFGDCLTYAVAKIAGQPLLATGKDFPKTDLPLA